MIKRLYCLIGCFEKTRVRHRESRLMKFKIRFVLRVNKEIVFMLGVKNERKMNKTDKTNLQRRGFLHRLGLALGSAIALPLTGLPKNFTEDMDIKNIHPIIDIRPMGFQWETRDPFLFCVHHEDDFPEGNDAMGPNSQFLNGRQIGDDFIIKDGFRMYHGKTVPGFPGHPHRGFETVTVVRKGFVDHSDSLGAAGRYGNGDVQWMTAGRGVQHSEMFPLLKKEEKNPLELFQIWLNLPSGSKMVEPHFAMIWQEQIPIFKHLDISGRATQVEIIAGSIGSLRAPNPPPNSWAANPDNEVGIWNIKMDAFAEWTLPKASAGINRTAFYYEGENLSISNMPITRYHAFELNPQIETSVKAGDTPTSLLILQGRPIAEPVIQYGPFVMNTKEEINEAFKEFNETRFGGWPWPSTDQVHPRTKGRFARHADGREEIKG